MATDYSPKTLQEAIVHFADLNVCQQALAEARWPDGVTCPTCGSKDVSYLTNQRRWQCKGKHPKRQFSAKVGTIFEDSPISLSKWFVAIWLIGSAKNGISSYELHRSIGVTQKSAWFMLHRIRLAMQAPSFQVFGGHVEVDETFIGGKARYMHAERRDRVLGKSDKRRGGPVGKVAVMGLLARHGLDGESHSRVQTHVVPNVKRSQVDTKVRDRVSPWSAVYTDSLPSYAKLDGDYIHKVIDHAECYAKGNVHTNGLENYWSLLKRTIRGTYVSVEPFHLFRYLDEQAFRFNSRKQSDGQRFSDAVKSVAAKRLTYASLTGKSQEQST